jgi:hypothetical protein
MKNESITYHKVSERIIIAKKVGEKIGQIDLEYHGPHLMCRLTCFVDGFSQIYRRLQSAKKTLEARVKNNKGNNGTKSI